MNVKNCCAKRTGATPPKQPEASLCVHILPVELNLETTVVSPAAVHNHVCNRENHNCKVFLFHSAHIDFPLFLSLDVYGSTTHLVATLIFSLYHSKESSQRVGGWLRHSDDYLFPISVHHSLTNKPHLDGHDSHAAQAFMCIYEVIHASVNVSM